MSDCVTENRASARRLDSTAAESDRQQAIEDVSCTRSAVAALKAIRQHEWTPLVLAQILCVLSGAVEKSPFSSTAKGEIAQAVLDDLCDDLTY